MESATATTTTTLTEKIGFQKLCFLRPAFHRPRTLIDSDIICACSVCYDCRKIAIHYDQDSPTKNHFFGTASMAEANSFQHSEKRKGYCEEE